MVDKPILEGKPVKMSEKSAAAWSAAPVTPRLELTEEEKEILKRQIYTPESQMSRLALLYSCATPYDLLLLVISSIAAIVGGALQPVSFVSRSPLVFNLEADFCHTAPFRRLGSSIQRILHRNVLGIAYFIPGRKIRPLLCVHRHWTICFGLHLDSRIHGCRRKDHPTTPREIPRRYPSPKHRIL